MVHEDGPIHFRFRADQELFFYQKWYFSLQSKAEDYLLCFYFIYVLENIGILFMFYFECDFIFYEYFLRQWSSINYLY